MILKNNINSKYTIVKASVSIILGFRLYVVIFGTFQHNWKLIICLPVYKARKHVCPHSNFYTEIATKFICILLQFVSFIIRSQEYTTEFGHTIVYWQ